MITLKGKSEAQISEEYKSLRALKIRKIKYIKALIKERPIPEDIHKTLNIFNRDTPITEGLREDARIAFHKRQEARLLKQEESLRTIEKEIVRRGYDE